MNYMRAMQLASLDGPEGLAEVQLPLPMPTARQVQIEVHFAGVSFVDLLLSRGRYQERHEPPFVPGIEVSGIVLITPPDSRFVVGSRVAAYVRCGGFAEVVLAEENLILPLPDELSFCEGAGYALNYQTAHFALCRRASLRAGEVLLVHGAAGGVGLACIQVGKALGAYVIAVVSNPDRGPVASAAGADATVVLGPDWRRDVEKAAGDQLVNVVVDPVGGDVFDETLRALAPEGRYLVVGFAAGEIPTVRVNRLLLKNVSLVGVAWGGFLPVEPDLPTRAAVDLAQMVGAGFVRPIVGKQYPLEDAPRALSDLEQRLTVGKSVLVVR